MPTENVHIFRSCGIFPSYPQDHDFMSQLAYYADTELVEYRGRPHIPMTLSLALLMDNKRKSSAQVYWKNLKREMAEHGIELVSRIHQLKARALDGKLRLMDCGDVTAVRRVLMYMRDSKPEELRMGLITRSDALLTFVQQNLFEGRSAYENEFYHRERRLLTDADAYEDLGYRGRR